MLKAKSYQLKAVAGFTLIELILSIFVISMVFFGFDWYYQNKRAEVSLNIAARTLLETMEEARMKSRAYFKDEGWSVLFNKSGYIMYRGQIFKTNSIDNKQNNLTGAEFIDPTVFDNGIGGKTNVIFFENGTGKTKNTGIIILRTKGKIDKEIRIEIGEDGQEIIKQKN